MKEVAKAAGVSIGTASNALRGVGQTAPETVRKVQAVAKKLGYAPDPRISVAMASIRQRTYSGHDEVIAFVHAYETEKEWRSRPIINRYWQGAQARASELGFRLEPYWLGGMSQARHSQILFHRGIRGLILAPHPEPDARLKLNWKDFATVSISRSIVEPVTHAVLDDHFLIMRKAMLQLYACGYRRIGFAMSRSRVERTRRVWLGAYLAYQQDAAPEDRVPVFEPTFERDDPRFPAALVAWFEKHRPDALLGLDDPDLEVLRRHGWRCPEHFGYASLDLDPGNRKQAGIMHSAEEVGRTAATLVVSMWRTREFGLPREPHVTLLEGTWRDGPSIRKGRSSRGGAGGSARRTLNR